MNGKIGRIVGRLSIVRFGSGRAQLARAGAIPRCIPLIDLSASIVLGLTWSASALAHLANPYSFLSAIYQYQIVDAGTGGYVAILLPFLELALGACLLGRVAVLGSLFTSGLLLTVFAYAQASAIGRNLSIGCGCFTVAPDTPVIDRGSLVASSLLASCALIGYVCHVIRPQPNTASGAP